MLLLLRNKAKKRTCVSFWKKSLPFHTVNPEKIESSSHLEECNNVMHKWTMIRRKPLWQTEKSQKTTFHSNERKFGPNPQTVYSHVCISLSVRLPHASSLQVGRPNKCQESQWWIIVAGQLHNLNLQPARDGWIAIQLILLFAQPQSPFAWETFPRLGLNKFDDVCFKSGFWKPFK